MKSVERLSKEKTPASRSEWPRASVTIGARTMWFAPTATTQAASPASAQRRLSSGIEPVGTQQQRGRPPGREVAERVVADVEALDVPGVALLQPLGHVHDDAEQRDELGRQQQARSGSGRPRRCGTPCRGPCAPCRCAIAAAPAARTRNVVHFDVCELSSRISRGSVAAMRGDPDRDAVRGRARRQRATALLDARWHRSRAGRRSGWRSFGGLLPRRGAGRSARVHLGSYGSGGEPLIPHSGAHPTDPPSG